MIKWREPNWRRVYVPSGCFFFTFVTKRRSAILCGARARLILKTVIQEAQVKWPFRTEAIVLLPDHLHAIWTLPQGDTRYSQRWGWIKKEFTKRWLELESHEQRMSAAHARDRRRGVWQRSFWEHTIRDENDLERYLNYIHYNPVKHQLVSCARDWPYSTFHRYVKQGVYEMQWGCKGLSTVENLGTVGE